MASLVDFISFALTLVVSGGAIAGIIFVAKRVSEFTSTTKEKLKSHGYNISEKGVAVQTQKRFNREDYVDATQRGFVKALGASSFRKVNDDGSDSVPSKVKTPEPPAKKTRTGILRRKSEH